jgi:hypothetical protein
MPATDAGGWSMPNSTTTSSTRTMAPPSTRSTSRGNAFSWPERRGCSAAQAKPTRRRSWSPPDLDIEITRSWPYLRHNLVHDLAALNKAEMILWDTWGLMEQEHLAERDLELLDRLAKATASADPDHSELRRLYEDEPVLQVPGTVTSYSPLGGEPAQNRSPVATQIRRYSAKDTRPLNSLPSEPHALPSP